MRRVCFCNGQTRESQRNSRSRSRTGLDYDSRHMTISTTLRARVGVSSSRDVGGYWKTAPGAVNFAISCSSAPMVDLESSLKVVFRADVSEYRFRQALCLNFLASEGEPVSFSLCSRTHPGARIRFPQAAACLAASAFG